MYCPSTKIPLSKRRKLPDSTRICHGSRFLCLCVVSGVLCFVPFVSLSVLLCAFPSMFSPLSLPFPPCMFVSLCLSVLFPSCFLPCLSLIISPVLLPPHSPPVPRSLISVSVYLSLGIQCTLCQFVVGVCVMSPPSSLCFVL